MKIPIALVFFLSFLGPEINAQSFKPYEITTLENLGVNYMDLNSGHEVVGLSLQEILRHDKKHKRKKIIGYVLVANGLTGIVVGSMVVAKSGHPIQEIFGGMILAGGIISAGISIPVFSSSKKHKNERERRIQELQTFDFNQD